jgi:hypothetical protein
MEGPDPAVALFRARRRLANAAVAVLMLVWVLRIPLVTARWPGLAEWLPWAQVLVSLPVVAALIWAWRCTICGGGIKLDGKTCAKCGRVYP